MSRKKEKIPERIVFGTKELIRDDDVLDLNDSTNIDESSHLRQKDLNTQKQKSVRVEEKPDNSALLQLRSPDYNVGSTEAEGEVEEIEEMFSSEGQTESSILKELFNGKNVKLKTEVSEDDISNISRLYFMSKYTRQPMLSAILDEFITLRVSKNRQSRKEFVEAHKDRQTAQNKGLLGGLFGGTGQ